MIPSKENKTHPHPEKWNVYCWGDDEGARAFCIAHAETSDEALDLCRKLKKLGAAQVQFGLDGEVLNP